ncbi:MAG: hypothetical protein IPO52_05160 [Gemmatimonadetes bacterium]|nr:hypothetical protein [Gemmatimonadota bacterium]
MRFLKRALTAVTLLLLVAFGTIYGLAQRELGRTYAVARKAPPRHRLARRDARRTSRDLDQQVR